MYTCIYNYSENIRRKKKIVLSIGRRLHVAGKFKNRQAAGGGGGDGKKEEKIQVEEKENLSTNDSLMENRNYRGEHERKEKKENDRSVPRNGSKEILDLESV